MLQAVRAVVHEGLTPTAAFEVYRSYRQDPAAADATA